MSVEETISLTIYQVVKQLQWIKIENDVTEDYITFQMISHILVVAKRNYHGIVII